MAKAALSRLGRRTAAPPISWLMQLTLSRPKLVSLAAGFTDSESLPVEDVGDCIDEVLRPGGAGRTALQYGLAQGDPVLRELTAERLRTLDAVAASRRAYSPARIIITNGSQQLLYMVTEALCDEGDIVLVEDPTYFVYLGIVQSRGLRARAVRMEEDGVDLSQLDAVLASLKRSGELRRVKAFYLVSYFQNPTGITTRFEKKAALLEILRRYERAAGHPIYVLEDAAYRELRFKGRDVPSALAVRGSADRVVYAGTYSKPFATGLRVGFGLLPEPLFTTVLRIKGNHDFGTSNLLQHLVARALVTGRYEKHLERLRTRYARKAGTMLRGLRAHCPAAARWLEPEGGLYFWVRLPHHLRSGIGSKLFRTALGRNVLYVPGGLCYSDDPTRRKPDHEMRVSFGGATERSIRIGIARLGGVLREFLDR